MKSFTYKLVGFFSFLAIAVVGIFLGLLIRDEFFSASHLKTRYEIVEPILAPPMSEPFVSAPNSTPNSTLKP